MPRAATSWTLRGVSGIAAIAVSALLGAAALWLVPLGASQKQVQLGVLLGLWAALIAAFLVVDARGVQPAIVPAAAELDQARAQAAELNLEVSLRREVERVLIDQLASLREEVAALRAEVVDKLGGQLRLERIETTRVIGSDLEALQHEIRRLAASRTDSLAAPARAVASSGAIASSPSAQAGQDGPGDIVDAELVEFPPAATALPPPTSPPTTALSPDARPAVPATPAAPFAGLPRLTPLQEDLGLLSGLRARGTGAELVAEQQAGRRRAPDLDRMSEDPRYQGRRRADGDPVGWFARLDS